MSKLSDSDHFQKHSRYPLKRDQSLHNPCLKEHHQSLKCLDDNDYDRDECRLQFLNYKNCWAFWNRVQSERRAKGIKPYLPLPEERDRIKAEYLRSMKE